MRALMERFQEQRFVSPCVGWTPLQWLVGCDAGAEGGIVANDGLIGRANRPARGLPAGPRFVDEHCFISGRNVGRFTESMSGGRFFTGRRGPCHTETWTPKPSLFLISARSTRS